ncbi:ORF6N domain-containing protein [Pedobacter sp. N36a]|uniref:ORF6N domain-containing protein n=1 Tax=Pedobacter sp. N36a TaxID=2767996 RepID=UPI0021039F7D|nr:ORF6N domain-containing protein [Pedobacter sp. N36a]
MIIRPKLQRSSERLFTGRNDIESLKNSLLHLNYALKKINPKYQNVTIPDEVVMSKIYMVRDQKVMLDRDLAELYGVDTKVLKQAVRRHITRFPEDFMFEMTKEELKRRTWRDTLYAFLLYRTGSNDVVLCVKQ